MPFFLLRRLCGLLFLASLFFSVQPAFSADCESYHPEARRADTSHPDDGWIVEKYGRVCTRTDEDQGQWDYYTQSEAVCKSLPGFIVWIKDQGAGFNRCIFDPPESDGGGSGESEQSGGETTAPPPPGPNSCQYANDGACDEPAYCASGTDTNDCRQAAGSGNTVQTPTPPSQNNSQWYSVVKVCNHYSEKATVAASGVREKDAALYTVEGWWIIEPGNCARLGRYRKGYFYLYSYAGKRVWEGSRHLCVRSKKFMYLAEGGKCTEYTRPFWETQLRSDERTINLE